MTRVAARRKHKVFASWYPGRAEAMDRAGFAEYRRRLLSGLTGHVLELGAGSGLNFAHYPAEVERVVAVEPEPTLRARAESTASELAAARAMSASTSAATSAATSSGGPQIEVVDAVAEDLSAYAGKFDAAVCSLVLCSVPDQRAALEQLATVLRPGGQIRLLEHVGAPGGVLAPVQRALDATIWPWIGAGCHCSRDVTSAVVLAGLKVTDAESFRFPAGRLTLPTSPHVLLTVVLPRRAQ
ncbi:class I SAM-dependent methyltransferase [Actinospica durhamensis]|uniref:Class I SAM-dependent methyltransferase n=1 Tax=Actinospica durhamensis TaxID=1508375 RepID=A0A941IPC5_9ACTN|nr:class I SAM-dependent methyltransferase [Actinospica durhamensis]MBR7836385.1 class I SAM-dependent methyltransferase [Actinospica durhamensis]